MTGLVQIEKTVTKPGTKPYIQRFWVKPPLTNQEPFDKETKQTCERFYQGCTNNEEFFTKLKAMGITWKQSTFEGINLMRAKYALTEKIKTQQGIPKPHYEAIMSMVNKCSDINVVQLWLRHTLNMKVHLDPKLKSPHYSPAHKTINLKELVGHTTTFRMPYETFFHESGHHVDHQHHKQGYSVVYKNGVFSKALRRDVHVLLKKFNIDPYDDQHSEQQLQALKTYLSPKHSKHEYKDVSDIIEGVTYGGVQLGVGHGEDYWVDRTINNVNYALPQEAFAEMTSATLCNPQSLECIKKHLPNAYKVYQEMIKSMLEA